jgi:glycosyltransferase involved in cell wall biosynthesis
MKNILLLVWRDLVNTTDFGGSEVYSDKIATGLKEQGYNVTIFSSRGKNQKANEILDGIKYIRRGSRYTVYFWAAIYYLLSLRKTIDFIIDVENGIPFFSPLYSKKPKVILVHHFHNGQWFKEFPFPIAVVGYYIERILMPFVYRNTKFITVSNSSKLDLEYLGIEPKHIEIGYNGTSFENVKRPNKKVLYKDPTILYLGRLREYKRIDLAVKAVKELKASIPNIKLIIAGKGDDEDRLKSIAKDLGISKNVEFKGFISEEEKSELLTKSWVYVNPSSKEGWGIVNIEANYYGTPVVGFNVFGVRDSVKHGYSGYLAENFEDFVNKLNVVLSKKGKTPLALTFRNNCTEWADRFNWSDTVEVFNKQIRKQLKIRTKVKKEVFVEA